MSSDAEKDGDMDASRTVCGYKDVDELSQVVLKSVMGAVRCSNDLPVSGDDLDFCSSFSAYQQYLGVQGTRLLQLIQSAMRYHGSRGSIAANNELTDDEDRFDVLVDANDQLLERVGTLLDEISGLRKKDASLVLVTKTPKQAAASGGWNKQATPASSSSTSRYKLVTARNIRRPQVLFKDKIDNTEKPFVPKIVHKPNALKPLAESLQCDIPDDIDPSFCYPHAYQFELDNYAPNASWLEKCEPQRPLPIDDTPLMIVATEQDLLSLCQHLKTQSEFAVDLEAHSYRSYQGFTCLIQISTRNHDYIIDALALREHLHALNDSFTDPKILKVLHGADQDILWLQRDFGVYLVGLFDTHQASRSMAFQRHRLQDLLWHYCSVEANKEYQLEDWRIRPLPEDFLLYARMDTHYLLYIYDCLKNDLLHRSNEQKNILMSVFQRSTQICAKRYVKPHLSKENFKNLLISHRKTFNPQQMAALKSIVTWRDDIARQVDESSGFVLPNLMMLQIAELLPREPEGILACCSSIPPLVQEYLMELHQVIKDARETHSAKKVDTKLKQSLQLTPLMASTKLAYCPLDLSYQSEEVEKDSEHNGDPVRSQLFEDEDVSDIQIKSEPALSALSTNALAAKKTKAQRRADGIRESFVNPFSKYMPQSDDATKDNKSAGDVDKWMLLPNTTKPSTAVSSKARVAEVLATAPVILFEPPPKSKVVEKDKEPFVATVRQQLSGEKRQSKVIDLTCDSELASAGAVSKKKRKLKSDDNATTSSAEQFIAHDYSGVNYNEMLQDGNDESSSQKQKKKKKKNRDFDPTSSLAESDMKGVAKSRPLLQTASNKNLTYGKNLNSGHAMPKIPWPKR